MATFATYHNQPYKTLSNFVSTQPLRGKSILITGAGRGVGEHITKELAVAGALRIAIVGRNKERILAARDQFAQAYPSTTFTAFAADITDESAIKNVFQSLGFVPDILVNNAGYFADTKRFIDEDIKQWWSNFEINILGTAIVTKEYIKAVTKTDGLSEAGKQQQQQPPVVLNVSTVAAHFRVPLPAASGYVASKAGQLRFFEHLRFEHPEVRFINIHPGLVDTDGYTISGMSTPARGFTSGELVGQFFAWAATEDAAFLNGRFVWAEWDVEDLKAKRDEILAKDLLLFGMDGVETVYGA